MAPSATGTLTSSSSGGRGLVSDSELNSARRLSGEPAVSTSSPDPRSSSMTAPPGRMLGSGCNTERRSATRMRREPAVSSVTRTRRVLSPARARALSSTGAIRSATETLWRADRAGAFADSSAPSGGGRRFEVLTPPRCRPLLLLLDGAADLVTRIRPSASSSSSSSSSFSRSS